MALTAVLIVFGSVSRLSGRLSRNWHLAVGVSLLRSSSGDGFMLQSPDAFLIVEKGKPYGIGEALPLSRGRALLGRSSQEYETDFSFLSPYVSRRHAAIEYMDGMYA